MAVGACSDEQRRVLLDRRTGAGGDHARDHQRVGAGGAGIVCFGRDRGQQSDHRRRAVDPQCAAIAVCRAQDDTLADRRYAQAQCRIDRQPDPARRKRDAGLDAQLPVGDPHRQSPRDMAETDRPAQVQHRFAQPILQMLQVLGGNPQAFHELGA